MIWGSLYMCFLFFKVCIKCTCWNWWLESLPDFKFILNYPLQGYFLKAGVSYSLMGLVSFRLTWHQSYSCCYKNGSISVCPLQFQGQKAEWKSFSWVVNGHRMCQDTCRLVSIFLPHLSSLLHPRQIPGSPPNQSCLGCCHLQVGRL